MEEILGDICSQLHMYRQLKLGCFLGPYFRPPLRLY